MCCEMCGWTSVRCGGADAPPALLEVERKAAIVESVIWGKVEVTLAHPGYGGK